ncbi:unnamed protein product, partial [marine sediment metagenome]
EFALKWFNPTITEVCSRAGVINKENIGALRFYCSDNCKQKCSLYAQKKYPKGFKKYHNRLHQTEWANMIKKRDNYECQICGSKKDLMAHHYEGLNVNPIMSADLEMGITLCKECDKLAHSEVGCRRIDLTKERLCHTT